MLAVRSLVVLAAAALVAGGRTSSVDGTAAPQSAGNPTGPAFPSSGTIDLTLTADRGAADGAVVSLGVPFPPGALRDDKLVSVLDPAGTAVAIHTESLARWPADGSVRSVLVAFRATLDANAVQKWTVEYGLPPRGGDAGLLAPNPDGPVIATLTARHYAASRVSGVVLPKADNVRFKQYDDTIAAGGTEKPLQDYGLVCSGGAEHRTYYDGSRVDAAVSMATSDLRHNRVPWISFKLPYSWEDMRDGRGDEWTRQLARRMAKLDGPVWLAFHHEPEGDGDLRAWTQMQARLAPIVRRNAPNVAYSIILTGWNQLYGNRQFALDRIWPKRTKIDLVGFDVYDKYGVPTNTRKHVEHTDFERDYFPRFREFARRHKVAWGISETGQTDRSAAVNPRWMEHTYQSLSRHDGVALTYFNTRLNSVAPWRLKGAKERAFADTLRNTPTL